MLVANQDSNLISVFARDPRTGELAVEAKSSVAAETPMRILFVFAAHHVGSVKCGRGRPKVTISRTGDRRYKLRRRRLRLALQLLGLVVGDERIDDGLQAALHHQVELVQREADAVVGERFCGKL
jgi:hypothetical protein